MKLGTVKTGCIAAVQARTSGWTQKVAGVSSFFLPPLFFLFLFLEVSISVPETCPTHTQHSPPRSSLLKRQGEEQNPQAPAHTTSLSSSLPAQPQLELKCSFILSPG